MGPTEENMGFVEETAIALKGDSSATDSRGDKIGRLQGCDADSDDDDRSNAGTSSFFHQSPYSDEELEHLKEARRKTRQKHRNSFVAGSKIERFNANDDQLTSSHHRWR
jgi:hypothetical protein